MSTPPPSTPTSFSGFPGDRRSRAQASADKVAGVLLALEAGPLSPFGLTPLAVRTMGADVTEAFVILRVGGRRHGLTLDEALLAARCLRDERAFGTALAVAGLIERAAGLAEGLLSRMNRPGQGFGGPAEPAT